MLDGEKNLPTMIEAVEKATIMAKAHSIIQLSLSNEILKEMIDEINTASL